MTQHQPLTALGLMSGTSLDGIDAAVIKSDGERLLQSGAVASAPYDPDFRQRLRDCLGLKADAPGVADVAAELTLRHREVVARLLDDNNLSPDDIDLIGFHGHTTVHRPEQRLTVQIGDPALLAAETGIKVVGDFRLNDVAKGGQGAPFASLYHLAMTRELEKPLAVLNIGGVANVTWIGPGGSVENPEILAFDTGPGNALIDDWMGQAIGRPMDEGGRLARSGTLDENSLLGLLDNPYFARTPPKSLDRDDFAGAMQRISGLSAEDGAMTLSAFSVAAIVHAQEHFPEPAKRWLVCGGGRLNGTLMELLARSLGVPVDPIEAADLNGDALEAQAFAFLAIRSFYGMPLSMPNTTGVPRPLNGGVLYDG
ncbi:MAG: anhydro-N-acetylmuramic acid kinase [Rhodospirillaceae bacterium]|nr:anhydro-N-acetylmuramic acid kinase [Rhodospirillaceae bacterium]MBL6942697.1 anhydro-N-acetylmuramic acid kinase [Rhodospirillales bacterium]